MSWPDRLEPSQPVGCLTPTKMPFGTMDGTSSAIDQIVGVCPGEYQRRMTFSNQLKIIYDALRYIEAFSGAAHILRWFLRPLG